MPTTIIPKRSSVAGKVPLSTDLQPGEIAVNLADLRIFTKTAAGVVVTLADMAALQAKIDALTARVEYLEKAMFSGIVDYEGPIRF